MLKFDQHYITLDTETEGLNLYYSRPWQVSWVEHQGTKKIAEFDLYVDIPDPLISSEIKKMTGFDQKKYDKEKLSPREVSDLLSKRLYDKKYIILGQNILNFDIYMVAVLQRMAGVKVDYSYLSRVLDVMVLGKAWKHELEKPTKDFLSWQLKILGDKTLKKRVSQIQLLKDLDIEFEEKLLHNALYDVGKCKDNFDKLKQLIKL